MSAAVAGLTAGIAGPLGHQLPFIGQVVVQNIVRQGVNMALQQQQHFSWTSLAASAVAASVFTGSNGDVSVNGLRGVTSQGFDFSRVASDAAVLFSRNIVQRGIQVALEGHGKIDVTSIAADSFGNALGNSIVGAIQSSEAEKQALATQRDIAGQGVDYFKNQMAAAGATQQQIDDFANSAEAQRLVGTAQALTAAQEQYGKPFDQLTPAQQAEVLKPLYQRIIDPVPGNTTPVGAPMDGVVDLGEVVVTAGAYEPTLIESAASVLDTGANAVNRLVQAVGGEQIAAGLVTGIQAAIYGVPKTAINLAVGELTQKPAAYLSEKLSSLFQRSVFDGTGDSESVRQVSDSLASFTVSSAFESGRGVVGNAGRYMAAKSFRELPKERRPPDFE